MGLGQRWLEWNFQFQVQIGRDSLLVQSELSKDVEQFLIKNIDSVAELEGLLLMQREAPAVYSASSLAKRLYIDENSAAEVLRALDKRGFLATAGTGESQFTYQPKSDALRESVDQLEEVYSRYLIPITHLLHTKRSSAVQQFADAFRLRDKN